MKILFDQFGNPLSLTVIKNDLDRLGTSYTATCHDIKEIAQRSVE